jgi:lambda repressor-like predicted transcriptional regulator
VSCTRRTTQDMTQIDFTVMHPADIKAGLEKRGFTLSDIGRKTNRTRQEVSAVVNNAADVFGAIAEVLQSPV